MNFAVVQTFCFPSVLLGSAATTAMTTKTSLENEHLGNDDYFVVISSSSHPLLLTEHVANGLVEASLSFKP